MEAGRYIYISGKPPSRVEGTCLRQRSPPCCSASTSATNPASWPATTLSATCHLPCRRPLRSPHHHPAKVSQHMYGVLASTGARLEIECGKQMIMPSAQRKCNREAGRKRTPGVVMEISQSAFLFLVLVWGLILIWPLKGAAADSVENDQNIEVIINGAAALVKIQTAQTRINAVSEFFSLAQLKAVKGRIKKILSYANELGVPRKVPLNEARGQCPLLGGKEVQPDPTLGPHPSYLPNPSKWESPLELFTRTNNNKSTCSYTIAQPVLSGLGRSIASYHYAQQASAWQELSHLLSPNCANGSTGQGMIKGEYSHPREGEYSRIIFPHNKNTNLILCGEMCRNMMEMSTVNCSNEGTGGWGEGGCGSHGCRTYSYNPLTRACHFSPHSNPSVDTEWFTDLGKPGGKTAIFASVHCQAAVLVPKISVRAPRSHNNEQFPLWSARAACKFDPLIAQSRFQVYTRCTTAGSLIKSIISPSSFLIEEVEKRIKRKYRKNHARLRRSPFDKSAGVGNPHILSFLSRAMLSVAPKLQTIPAIGPPLSIVLGLAGSLLPLIQTMAHQTASDDNYPLNTGVVIIDKHPPVPSSQYNWTQQLDMLSIDYQAETTNGVSLATWLESIIGQARMVERSISDVLDNPYPRNRKVRKYLHKHRSEVNYVTFYSSPHFLRRQFYVSSPIKSGNPIETNLLVSLDPDLPLKEGWRSTVSLGGGNVHGPVSVHCTSQFSDSGPIPQDCIDKNKLGSPMETVFPASSKYLLIKILGVGKIVQVLCGGEFLPATFASKGIFVALVGRNCDVYSEGGLLIQAENGKTEWGYKVLLDEQPRENNQSIPMPGRITDRFSNNFQNFTASDIFLAVWLLIITTTIITLACCHKNTMSCDTNVITTGMKYHVSSREAPGKNEPQRLPPPLPPLRNYPDYTSMPYAGATFRKTKDQLTNDQPTT